MTSYSLILWIIFGGLAGWLTGMLLRGRGYGCIGNVVVGIIGAVIGGWLFRIANIEALPGLIGSVFTAIIGAVVLITVLGLLTERRH
ncbi:MAG: GlsB/YeaQ/YmgE family stress response membrane protein [Anaerolineae bacterium]